MRTYLRDSNSKTIVVFFAGWALDEKPFEALESKGYDLLFVYDYSDLSFEFDFSKYDKKILIAFSYGVFISSLLQEKLPVFDRKIAVNGTLRPIGKEFGINEKIFKLTLDSISPESMQKFYSRMFDNNLDYEYFMEHLPSRNWYQCKEELAKISECYQNNQNLGYTFDKAIISNEDKIFPAKSQINFWQNTEVKNIEAGHFPFYKFNSVDEIIEL